MPVKNVMEDDTLSLYHEKDVAEGYAWVCDHCGARYRFGEIAPLPSTLGRIYQDTAICKECKEVCRNWEVLNNRVKAKLARQEQKAKDKKARIIVTAASIALFFLYPGFLTYAVGLVANLGWGFLKYEALAIKLIVLYAFLGISILFIFLGASSSPLIAIVLYFLLSCIFAVMIPILRTIWDKEKDV